MKLLALTLLIISSSTFAADPMLMGKYKFVGYECASGNPSIFSTGSQFVKASVSGHAEFLKSGLVKMEFSVNQKLEENYAKFIIDTLRGQLAEIKKDAESEPNEAIAYLEEQLKYAEALAGGQVCEVKTVHSYSAKKGRIKTKSVSEELTCSDEKSKVGKTDIQKYTLNDGQLKIINRVHSDENAKFCRDQSDISTLVFEKIVDGQN